jgi:hypothetical protein
MPIVVVLVIKIIQFLLFSHNDVIRIRQRR